MTADISRRTFLSSVFAALSLSMLPIGVARGQGAEQYTFVVLGTDKRTSNDPENSDVIMLSRVALDAGTVRTLSIPRDLYVEIPGHGYDKINAAFNLAVKADPQQRWEVGAAATMATITQNFGLQFDGVAFTDMSVFPQLIDAVGGVIVNNPYDLTDQYWPAGTVLPAGPLALDGATALGYVRARSQDGDGGRVMRQHLVLQALLAKLQEPAQLRRIPELIAELQNVVKTTIPADVILRLVAMVPTLSSEDLAFTNIDRLLWPDYTAAGAWIYQGDWSTLPGYVESWLAGDV
jgi:polyisoprenyl-teichoic acid--peptidoglycan teichoic acid transferase